MGKHPSLKQDFSEGIYISITPVSQTAFYLTSTTTTLSHFSCSDFS